MKAVVIHAAHDLRIEERPVSAPSACQVAIELQVGGICGSDLHYYNHGGFGPIRLREPMVLGHEVAGKIISIGADVETFKPGQLVAISPSRQCNDCEYCLRGQQNHCLNMRFYGSAMPFPHIQGAFQQHLIADAAQCVLAEGLSASEAAMTEPLAVSLHAVRQSGDLVGKTRRGEAERLSRADVCERAGDQHRQAVLSSGGEANHFLGELAESVWTDRTKCSGFVDCRVRRLVDEG